MYTAKTWHEGDPISYEDMNHLEIQYDELVEDITAFFTGAIIYWSGLLSNIPEGWLLCDGENGAPDLLGKFIKGTPTALTEAGSEGGSISQSTPGHTHKYSSANTDTNPPHNHDPSSGGTSSGIGTAARNIFDAGSHSHTLPLIKNDLTVLTFSDIRPPYYELAYIIKT